MSLEIVLFLAIGVIVVTLFFFYTRHLSWLRKSHIAHTIEGLAVALALLLAGLEYALHYQGDKDRKSQAVIDLLRSTIGSQVLDRAASALYDHDPLDVLRMPYERFDKDIASLSDTYFAAGSCETAGQCDATVVRSVFCFDFLSFRYAYNYTHPPDKRWQRLDDDPVLAVFKSCPDHHRFKQGNGTDLKLPDGLPASQ
jgi:hypothetical protein